MLFSLIGLLFDKQKGAAVVGLLLSGALAFVFFGLPFLIRCFNP